MLRPLLCALALVPLAACDDGKPGTEISINAAGADGNVVAQVNGAGETVIDTPFFKGKVTLPKLKLDASNFDINGVHLYPGSTISGMNVYAHDTNGKKDGNVRVSFASPATPATVRDWFDGKLNAAGIKVAPGGKGLVGTTDDGKPFALDLTLDGADKSKGVITIGG